MKKFVFFILATFLSIGLAFAQNTAPNTQPTKPAPTTAERHLQRGVQCASCHVNNDTTVAPRQQQCLACHGGSYDAMRERTQAMYPNPHFTHIGDRDCNTCHIGHQPSQVSCARCHKFDIPMQ